MHTSLRSSGVSGAMADGGDEIRRRLTLDDLEHRACPERARLPARESKGLP